MEISLDYDETNIGIGNPRWMLPDIAFTSIYSIHMTNDGNHIKAIIKYGIMDKKDLIIEM